MKRLMTVALLAMALGACATNGKWGASEKDEGNEVKVKLADCPKAVQDTIRKEAAGANVADVDKETEHGKTLYEADAIIGGKNYEIKVAPDGQLISKKLDNEAEEKEEKGEHNGK